MSRPWQIRAQADTDAHELAQLLIEVDASWGSNPFRRAVRDGGLQAALDIINQPRLTGVVAVLDNRIVGSAALRDIDNHVHLVQVMVDPDQQGRGIGRELVTTMTRHAAEHGHDIYLDVLDDSHHAIALYRSLGFTPVERTFGAITGRPGTLMRLDAAPLGATRHA